MPHNKMRRKTRHIEGLSQRITLARRHSNLSVKALSQQLHVKESVIYDWERGRVEPNLSDCLDLCRGLGITLQYLVGLPEDMTVGTGLFALLTQQYQTHLVRYVLAREKCVDMTAEVLGISPLAVRRLAMMKQGEVSRDLPYGVLRQDMT